AAGAGLLLVVVLPGRSHGATFGEAATRVSARVGTIVTLEAGDVRPQVPPLGGDITAEIDFRVSANVGWLWFQCFASDLFKAGDPLSGHRISRAGGVSLRIPQAIPLGGTSYLRYLPGGPGEQLVEGFRVYPTEPREWESSSNGTFTRDGVATFSWSQAGPLLPRGTYAGYVKVLAFTVSP
ncbi:MAG: hypothetical protein ACYDA8_06010, partial [Deferrisomatales bacterium]